MIQGEKPSLRVRYFNTLGTDECVSEESTEAGMVYDELHAVCKRYCSEGDRLTALGIVGALEAVKADILDMLKRHNDKED